MASGRHGSRPLPQPVLAAPINGVLFNFSLSPRRRRRRARAPCSRPQGTRAGVGRLASDTPTQVNKQKPPPPGAPGGRGARAPRGRGPGSWGRRRAGAHAERAAARSPHGPGSPELQVGPGPAGALTLLEELFFFIIPGVRARGLGPGASSRGGWRRCPRRRRRSALPPPGGLASFVAPVTLGAGLPARSHTRARPLPAPRRPPSRRPRGPGPRAPARPRRSPGPARGGRPGPRPAVPSSGR